MGATSVFQGNLGEKKVDVRVETLGSGRFSVTVDGKSCEVDAVFADDGGLSFIIGNASYEARFTDDNETTLVALRGAVVPVHLVDERSLAASAAGAGKVGGDQNITAPMPGKIVKILTKVGETVPAGHGLIVMEAMKMENELKALHPGVVARIAATEGSSVEKGALLMVLSPPPQ